MKTLKIIFKILRWTLKIALFLILIPLRLLAGGLKDPYDPWNPDSPYSSR